MTERNITSSKEKCVTCPNRSKLSSVVARVAFGASVAPGCEGSITVSHGVIVTQIRQSDEPAPERSTWNTMVVSGETGERRYSKNEWSSEEVCGLEEVMPHRGEVEYDPTLSQPFTAKNGKRYATFIKGDADQIDEQRFILAMSTQPDDLPHINSRG